MTTPTLCTHLLQEARRLVAGGICVLPVSLDGEKAVTVKWKQYQTQFPTDQELRAWFRNSSGIATLNGAISGNLETLDFDEPDLYPLFEAMADDHGFGEEVRRCPLVITPSGGAHLRYRSSGAVGSSKALAYKLLPLPEGAEVFQEGALDYVRISGKRQPVISQNGRHWTRKIRIETRGEATPSVAPGGPSCVHRSGRPYLLQRGDLAAVPVLSPETIKALHTFAGAFNEYEPEERPQYIPARRETASGPLEGLSPGDDFKERGDGLAILIKHGWRIAKRAGDGYLMARPDEQRGSSATYGTRAPGLLFCFSPNSVPFETGRAYNPWQIYTLLEHGGDFESAARALYADGYGEHRKASAVEAQGGRDPIRIPAPADAACSVAGAEQPLPEEALPAAPHRMTKKAWERHGSNLKAWGDRQSERYRWAIAEWYSCTDVAYGHREEYARQLFGAALSTIQHWAKAWQQWPDPEGRAHLSMSACIELSDKAPEIRQQYAQRSRDGERITVEKIREELGGKPKPEPKPYQFFKECSADFQQEFVEAIHREGLGAVEMALKQALSALTPVKRTYTTDLEYEEEMDPSDPAYYERANDNIEREVGRQERTRKYEHEEKAESNALKSADVGRFPISKTPIFDEGPIPSAATKEPDSDPDSSAPGCSGADQPASAALPEISVLESTSYTESKAGIFTPGQGDQSAGNSQNAESSGGNSSPIEQNSPLRFASDPLEEFDELISRAEAGTLPRLAEPIAFPNSPRMLQDLNAEVSRAARNIRRFIKEETPPAGLIPAQAAIMRFCSIAVELAPGVALRVPSPPALRSESLQQRAASPG